MSINGISVLILKLSDVFNNEILPFFSIKIETNNVSLSWFVTLYSLKFKLFEIRVVILFLKQFNLLSSSLISSHNFIDGGSSVSDHLTDGIVISIFLVL